jgi:DNA (cytosine-5)-methyltransferase 1
MDENINEKQDLKYIDLFAGCGGLSLGLHLAGWKGLFAIEKSPFAFETLKFNLIDNRHHFSWPTWFDCGPHEIDDILQNYKVNLQELTGQIDLVAGGPPCQGFSMAGKRIEDDVRNRLVYSYVDFIKIIKPKILLFENVKGFTFPFNKEKSVGEIKPYSDIVISELEKLGYDVKPKIIDFCSYGIPQRRERFILVGSLQNNASDFFVKLDEKRTQFLKEKGLKCESTVEDAISDLLQINLNKPTPDRTGFFSGTYADSKTPYQTFMRKGYARKGSIPDSHSFANHGDDTTKLFAKLIADYPYKNIKINSKHEREEWKIKKRGVTILAANEICPTLTSHPDDYIHYAEPRILTVREYARIQSFPDWYEIKRKYTTGGYLRKTEVPRYTQIGNAIPPLFAELAGIVLMEMLNK